MAPWAANAQTRETQTFDFEDQTIPSTWTNDATYPWVVTDAAANGGTYSIKSGNAGENSTTSSITATFTFLSEGTISFAARCSCEQTNPSYDWDYGTFYIDGEQQGAKIINSDDFSSYNYDVDAGEHTFMWKYKKDGSVGSNDDCLYVDDIVVNLGTAGALNKPTNLAYELTPGNGTVATLSWQQVGTVTGWQIMLNNNESNLINVSTNPYTLTGLTPETTYTACVRATDGNNVSAWSSSVTFTPTNAYMFTVNDGTTTSAYVPVYGYWTDSQQRSEFIIPASTLSSLNGTNLTSMKFYANYDFTSTGTFYAYLMEVAEETFSGTTFYTEEEATIVYQGTITVSSTEGMTINFSGEGFDYNGGNLLVGFYKTSGGNYSNSSNDAFYGVSASGASISSYSSYSATQRNFLPKVTFSFNPTQSSCKKPTNVTVSDITSHEATVTWTENGEATAWIVRIGRDEYEVNTTSYTITGLNAQTPYTVQVRPVCTDVDDKWSDEVPFTTDVACPAPTLSITNLKYDAATINWSGSASGYDLQYAVLNPTTKDPYTNDGWYYYDNGVNESAVGLGGNPFSWAVMFPAGTYVGNTLTAASVYDYDEMEGTLTIYNDGTDAPDNQIYTQDITLTGADDFVEFNLGSLAIDNTKNIWVVVHFESGATYAAATCDDENGDANGRWCEINGTWYDLANAGVEGSAFMIRAHFMNAFDPTTLNWVEVPGLTTNSYDIDNLEPGTAYVVWVKADCGDPDGESEWAEIFFTTPDPCTTPSSLKVEDITSNSANLTWNGVQYEYNVQYRRALHVEGASFQDDFENGIGQWTTIDGDGDNNNWYSLLDQGIPGHYNTTGFATSASYSGGVLNPDNYLVTPQMELGGTVRFWACAQDAAWPAEHFGIAVSTGGNTDAADFTTIQEWDMTAKAQGNWYLFTVDMSDYAGQTGYIAIRHFDCSDMFRLNVDDFYVGGNIVEDPWTTATADTENLAINSLEAETVYEWQVQAVADLCDNGVTEFTDINYFTTGPSCMAPTITDVEIGADFAIVSWESDAASFDIEVNDEVIVQGYTDTSYTIELEPATVFWVRVRANCGEDSQSAWSDEYLNVTDCGEAKEMPYAYGFEDMGEYYACWSAYSFSEENDYGRINMTQNEFETTEGDYAFMFSSVYEDTSYDQILLSPELNAENGVTVQFDYIAYNTTYGNETFMVGYSTDGDNFTWGDEIEASNIIGTDEWETYTETFPAGTKYVAIYYTSYYLYYLFIDNFRFTEATAPTQTTELAQGWNWFCSYVEFDDPVEMFDALKESLGENADMILSLNDDMTSFDGEEWFGDLDDVGIFNDQMYMIYTNTACTVELDGTPVDPADYEISINPGWNWIGFPSAEALDFEEAMAGFSEAEDGDMILSQNYMAIFDGEEWFSDIEVLVPGAGLMYYSVSEDEKTLVFQTGDKAKRANTVLTSIPMNKMNKAQKNGDQPNIKNIKKTESQQVKSLMRRIDNRRK